MNQLISAPPIDIIIDSLAHLICSDPTEQRDIAPIHRLSATLFDGFEPLVSAMGGDDTILTGDTVDDQPIWPVNVAVGYPLSPGRTDWPEGSWQFHRYKTLNPKEWRGKIHKLFPRMLDIATATVTPAGKQISARTPVALINGTLREIPRTDVGMHISSFGEFCVNPGWFGYGREAVIGDASMIVGMRLLGGLALRRRYYWSVLLGEGSGPRVRFLTDAIGMREAFRLRDIPSGKARRAALLHWVREHWRKHRNPSAVDRAWIAAHLRGARSFNWNSLVCEIEPSQEDAERLALQVSAR